MLRTVVTTWCKLVLRSLCPFRLIRTDSFVYWSWYAKQGCSRDGNNYPVWHQFLLAQAGIIALPERVKLDSLPIPGGHFRFNDVTSGTTMASPMCQYRSVPSLVAMGQFPCPREPNKSHFLFLEVISGSVTSLPVPLLSPVGVSISLC